MTMLVAHIRHVVGALAILTVVAATVPSAAQQRNPDGTPNPTASVVDEQTLLRQFPRIEGRIDIPNERESILIQPAGRTWDYFHEVILHWLGAIVIVGMIAILAIAYLIMGRIRISKGRSGIKIPRFNGFERFSHWLTAVSFVVLGLTGLNITFGKILLLPLIGPDDFSEFAQAAKYVHNFVSFSFVAGLILVVALWIRDNIPRQVDITAKGGGRLHQIEASPGGALQCRGETGLLVCPWGGCRRHRFRILADVSVLHNGYSRNADCADCSRCRRRILRRRHPRSYLYRHPWHGGCIRGHGRGNR